MTRIRLAEDHEIRPDVLATIKDLEAQSTGDMSTMRILAHRPDIMEPFLAFYMALQQQGRLGIKLVELVRMAVAQINQCSTCLSGQYAAAVEAGVTPELVNALPYAEHSDRFEPREQVAIAFAKKMAGNHWEVNDDDFAKLYEHFDEKEVVELIMNIVQFIGIGRMFAVIDSINPVCELPVSITPGP